MGEDGFSDDVGRTGKMRRGEADYEDGLSSQEFGEAFGSCLVC